MSVNFYSNKRALLLFAIVTTLMVSPTAQGSEKDNSSSLVKTAGMVLGLGTAAYTTYKLYNASQEKKFASEYPQVSKLAKQAVRATTTLAQIGLAYLAVKKGESLDIYPEGTSKLFALGATAAVCSPYVMHNLTKSISSYENNSQFQPIYPKGKLKDIVYTKINEVDNLIEYAKNKKIRDEYSEKGLNPYKGVLLYGPPGSGKTLLARAIAAETGAPIFVVKPADIKSKWVNQSEENIKTLFAQAAKAAEDSETGIAFIFLDEVETIVPERTSSIHESHNSLTNAILQEMDGFEKRNNIVVICGTNNPKLIDPAFLRSGRMDVKIKIDLPTKEERKKYIALYLKKYQYKSQNKEDSYEKVIDYINSNIADKASPADINKIIQNAAKNAVHNHVKFGFEHIKQAVERNK